MEKPNRSTILQELTSTIMKGDTQETVRLIELGLENNMSSQEIMDHVMIPASDRIAEEFRGADFYIPDVLFALRPIKTGLAVLRSHSSAVADNAHKILITTVAGDIHDIGKTMVAIFLQMSGCEVIDLGVDTTATEILQAVVEHKPTVLALSSLLTTTMGEMANVIELLEEKRLRRSIKVIVGGGPVSDNFAEFIGADGYAPNAMEAVGLVKKIIA